MQSSFYIPRLNLNKTKQRFSPINPLNRIFPKFEYISLNKNRKFAIMEQLYGINVFVLLFYGHFVSIKMKKKSFKVPKIFINENFSKRFLFRQIIKQQLILVLHRLFCFNLKATI